MTDSLKFGPEWLRVLSQDTTGTQVASGGGVGGGGGGGAPHRYQLAEHRYGREEMLALFDRLTVSRSGPDLLLRSFPTLYVEKPQPPLALVQMTEEEARTWQRGINSESVLRGPGSLRGGVGAGGGMGRGSVSMDRGVRGRGRGGGGYYVRGGMGGYEEESSGDGSSSGPWRRGIDSGSTGGSGNLGGPMTSSSSFNSRVTRSFDRSQGTVSERGWGERNGTVDSNDWNGSTSPRKDYGRGLMENWRSRGSTEEEDTWRVTNRTEKWGRNSWREGGSGTMDREQESGGRSWEGSGEGGGSHHRARSGGWEDGHRPNIHRHSWEEPDKLPEWATENLSESGGSFDASGAFHGGGGYSDDDEKGHVKDRPEGLRRLQQGLGPLRRNSGSRGGGSDGNRGPMLLRTVSESEADHHPSMMTGPSGGPSRSVSGHMAERSISSEVGSSPEGSKGSVLTSKQDTSIPPPNISNTSPPSVPITVQSSKSTPPHSPPVPTPDPQSRPDSSRIGQQNKLTDAGQTRASSVPTNTPNQMTLGMVDTSVSSLDARGQQRQRSEEDLERMQEVADDLVAKLMDEEEDEVEIRDSRSSGGVRQPGSKDEVGRDDGQVDGGRLGAVPGSTPSQDDPTATLGDKWYYQDPQGIVQGPFGSGEMADWFRAGYFNTTLLVRRACDECFSQLGDLMKLWGRIPFLPGPNPPPLKAPMADPAIAAASAPMPLVTPGSQAGSGGSMGSVNQAENLFMQQHYQYQILQRQLFMRQQAAVQAIMEKLSLEHQQSVIQQLMGGQQQGQGPQQPNQPPPHQPSPPHHAADGMNTFLQPPFKMQSDLGGPKNPVMALINQIHQQQQAKVSQSADGLIGPQIPTSPKVASDPISQLIQQVALQQQQQQQQPPPHPSNAGVPSHHQPQRPSVDQGRPPSPVPVSGGPGSQQPTPGGKQESDPIQSILRLLEGRSNGNPLVNQPPVEPVWGGPFAVQSWLAQAAAAGSQVGAPPGQLLSQGASPGSGAPISLWDLQGKDVKTEQQILEEQMRAEEERKKEEIRKQEEAAAKKKAEEEERKRKQLEEELRQKEAERRRLEEQMRKLEEEKRAEEARRKEEERRMAEERRRLEERLRQEQELKQKLLAEEKKQLQEMKRLAELKQKREEAEERKRKEKEEEAARKQKELEQQQLQEAEKKKQQQEEEIKRQKQQQQQQQDEAIRRLEIQRRLAEAQRKSQEAQMKGQEAQIAATAAAAATIPSPTPPTNQRQATQKSQAPWAQQQGSAAVQPTSPPIANLAEIQRMQEKEEKEMLQQRLAQKMREKEAAIAQAQTEREHHPQPESPVPVARPASGQQPKAVSGGGGGGSGGGSGTAIQLKWADKRPQPTGPVKSLAEIQAEEHEQQLARERERAEKAAQQASQSGTPASGGGGSSQGHSTSSATPVGGIWGSATSALTWAARSAGHGGWAAAAAVGAYGSQANHTSSAPANASQPAASSLSSSSSSSNSSNSSPAVWSNAGQNSWASNNVTTTASSGGGGFWEEVPATPQPVKSSGKQGGKSTANSGKTAASAAVTAQPAGGKGKGKSRKDEVMKIFEQNVQRSLSAGDEFTQWCLKTLGNLQTSVDIPTFVGFLKDIDSPYEVSDYVRNYLGDGKEAREFSRNFLERRSRWRNAQKAAASPPSEDDMCVPAPAVNPLSSEFQEVKGKGKKAKKNKMMRLDNRILGFSVTASHDRINVGDRDYGEGV